MVVFWWIAVVFCWFAIVSSNISEVIKTVLNFFYDKILHPQKAQKEYQAPKHSFKLLIFLVKKLSCLNDSGATKLVKVHTAIQTKSSLVGPVRKLNYLNDIKTSFLRPFKFFIFYKKILHALEALKALKAVFPLRCFLCIFLYFCSL